MILTFFLLFTTALTIFPCSLTCLPPAPVQQQQAEMSELNLEIMRQLLAEQARSLLSELRNQVKIEVTNQLEVHTTKLVQLEEEQELLRKHLNDISTQLASLVPVPQLVLLTCHLSQLFHQPTKHSQNPRTHRYHHACHHRTA